ncbi:hypothetical protein OG920_07625 [Streptomyces europaeiscabiei]|uniref:hypothetical protein n=1 Tax=Streptomyces TaxID=1883 RepID=UPI00211B040A|nr:MULTISPECIES: hypothetical protein [Streptomyces]MDX3587782.1 hypothetical protein [Streptomyces europaeiscabiei]MDX3616388.1 hypothetical protein [Streptomyces europaeiscabiei]MDX3630280.1 hypothetical protein [Streptomyces europaeiscabiei]MDX3652532.1 hypothetical protein [Streptomyces europaeiscabiei]WUD31327.1 hypothetical protein OG858_07835 [Streptomyces europaeiscabiei]
MTPTFSVTGNRRHILVPASAESLPQGSAQSQDPPIYRALLRTWADRGRTLPGRHDPEWVRLATPPSGLDQFGSTMDPFAVPDFFRGSFSVTRAPRGDGR